MTEDRQGVQFYEHIDYIENRDLWITIKDMLEARPEVIKSSKYLVLHPLEIQREDCSTQRNRDAKENREQREKRTEYVNYLKMVRDRFVSLMLKGGLDVSALEDLFSDLASNVDGNQNSLHQFTRLVAEDLISFGSANVLTDTQNTEATTEQDALEKGVRPYWIKVAPLDLPDWNKSVDGGFKFFRQEILILSDREDPSDEPRLLLWSKVGKLLEGKYTIDMFVSSDEEGAAINFHPIVKERKRHHSWKLQYAVEIPELDFIPLATNGIGDSCLKDVVPIAKKIYNKESSLDNTLNIQAYDRIFLAADLLSEDGSSDAHQQSMELSVNAINVLPAGSNVIKLDPTDPIALANSIDKDEAKLLKIAFNLIRLVPADAATAESGDTRREAKEDLYTMVKEKREQLLDLMNESIRNFAFYLNTSLSDEELEELKLSFAKELDQEDIGSFLDKINKATFSGQYPSLQKALYKRAIQQFELPEEAEILEEVEGVELPTEQEQEQIPERPQTVIRQRLQGVTNARRNS